MNAFWDFVDWILPPVRIIDDLGAPDYTHRPRSTHHHRDQHQTTRRLSGRDHDKDRDRDRRREREREKDGRTLEHEREREQLRQRIQQLERDNDSITSQLRATREELSKITAALFPPLSDRASQSFPASPPEPSTAVSQQSPTSPLPPMPSPVQELARTSSQMTQYSAEAALADPKRLRVLYTSLRATYGDARQTILSQAEELSALKSFLSKTDDWSGAQLLQALADLNSEIVQLAASVAEEFAPTLREDPRAPSAAKERDREIVRAALGHEMLRLLEEREHAADPTLVQFALQAWEVWCVARVMDAFCYGLPAEVDEALRLIFERMQDEEPQPTTSRWRALTYKHARSLLARPRARPPTEPPSPDTASPSPFNSAPASIASSSSLPPPLVTLTEANLRGVLAILALSGCTDARGLHRDPLRGRYGNALSRISARAERIASVMKQGVLSGLFEVVWVPPCRPTDARETGSRRASVVRVEPPTPAVVVNVNGAGEKRGKGKEREWVKEVERARQGETEDEGGEGGEGAGAERWFEWGTMENVYAGHCNERCRVLCTVELGLAFSRKPPEREGRESEGTVDGDGMLVRPASGLARPVSRAGEGGVEHGAGVEGGEGRDEGAGEGTGMVRNLLLKPRVLLESVVDIL